MLSSCSATSSASRRREPSPQAPRLRPGTPGCPTLRPAKGSSPKAPAPSPKKSPKSAASSGSRRAPCSNIISAMRLPVLPLPLARSLARSLGKFIDGADATKLESLRKVEVMFARIARRVLKKGDKASEAGKDLANKMAVVMPQMMDWLIDERDGQDGPAAKVYYRPGRTQGEAGHWGGSHPGPAARELRHRADAQVAARGVDQGGAGCYRRPDEGHRRDRSNVRSPAQGKGRRKGAGRGLWRQE